MDICAAETLPLSGTYAVYGRWVASTSNANNARYVVAHANGTTTVTANQQINGNAWRLLGSFTFGAGSAGSVTISNTATTLAVVADAVRFVRTGAAAARTVALTDRLFGATRTRSFSSMLERLWDNDPDTSDELMDLIA